MQNQTFLLSSLCNQGLAVLFTLLREHLGEHIEYINCLQLLQTRKRGFLSLIHSTSDSHKPHGCQRAQTSTSQLSCRRFFMLDSSRDVTADSRRESLPYCPLQKLAVSFPIGITTFHPYLKSSAPPTKVLSSHANRCLKTEGPLGINLVYSGRILASHVSGYFYFLFMLI